MLPTQPCNYFWITDQLMLDGLIRSDNRGSESVFPLYLDRVAADGAARFRANVAATVVQRLADRLGLRWLPHGATGEAEFGPLELVYYAYALFFSLAYRLRYADQLWSDFPRILLPRRPELFRELVRWGRRLVGRHLLRNATTPESGSNDVTHGRGECPDETEACWSVHGTASVVAGFPAYQSERISLNRDVWLEPVPRRSGTFTSAAIRCARSGSKTAAADARRFRSGGLPPHRAGD